jgi:hypothetical protein
MEGNMKKYYIAMQRCRRYKNWYYIVDASKAKYSKYRPYGRSSGFLLRIDFNDGIIMKQFGSPRKLSYNDMDYADFILEKELEFPDDGSAILWFKLEYGG